MLNVKPVTDYREIVSQGVYPVLEAKVKELEDENRELREKLGDNNDAPPFEPVENKHPVSTADTSNITTVNTTPTPSTIPTTTTTSNDKVLFQTNNQSVQLITRLIKFSIWMTKV